MAVIKPCPGRCQLSRTGGLFLPSQKKYEGSTSLDPGASFRTARPRNASRRRPFSLPMPETRNCGSSPDAQSLVVSRQLGSRSGQPLSDAAGNGLDVLVLAIDGC